MALDLEEQEQLAELGRAGGVGTGVAVTGTMLTTSILFAIVTAALLSKGTFSGAGSSETLGTFVLVTTIALAPVCVEENRTLVRMERYASAKF